MLKYVIVLAMPGVIAGLTLLHGWDAAGQDLAADGEVRLIEIGLALDAAAVRAALPQGLEPADGFTGGVAVYFVADGPTIVPQSSGYVWVDVKYGHSARYILRSFHSEVTAEAAGERSDALVASLATGPAALVASGGSGNEARNGIRDEAAGSTRYVVAVTSGPARLDVVVDPVPGACSTEIVALTHYLFASGADGGLEVLGDPFAADWCEAHVASVGVTAPVRDVLGLFAPEQVLWAGVATPLGSAMPEVPS